METPKKETRKNMFLSPSPKMTNIKEPITLSSIQIIKKYQQKVKLCFIVK